MVIFLRKEVSDEGDFLHANKHQSFLQFDAISMMSFAWNAQSTQIILKYLFDISREKLEMNLIFFHAVKYQSFL